MNIFLISWEWNLLSTSLVILIGIFFLVFILSFVVHFIFESINNKHSEDIAFNSERNRIFTLDVDASKIFYFDKQDMCNQVEMSLETFYRGFKNDQSEQLRGWIYSFTGGDVSKSTFLSLPSKIYSTGKDCISLFHITSYNSEKRILHFEKITLPGVSTKINHKVNKNYIKTIEQVGNIVDSNNKYKHHCLVMYIKLNHKTGKIDKNMNDDSYTYYSLYQPLISVYRNLNKRRFLTHVNDMDACIFDFDLTDSVDIENLSKKIIAKIERYFNIKAIPTLYTISIGCAYVKDFNEPLKNSVDLAEKLAIKAGLKEEGSNYIIEGTVEKVKDSKGTKEEILDVESLIANKTFRCYFTPILSTKAKENILVSTIKPYGTAIKDYVELVNAADRQGLLKELLEASFNTIGEAIGSDDYKFVFNIKFERISSVIEALNDLPEMKAKLYLLLNLSEIEDLFETGYDVGKYFDALEVAKIKVALNYDDIDLDAPKGILARCEMFLIVAHSEGQHSDERTKSELIAFKAVLQDYKKPIVVEKMLSITDMLFAKDLGYESFICESIAGTSSSPYIPEDDWKEEIEKMDDVDDEKIEEKDSTEEVVKDEE
jgi:hypothetical protein